MRGSGRGTPEIEAEIVHLHYVEHWPVRTIARQLRTHSNYVRRVLHRQLASRGVR